MTPAHSRLPDLNDLLFFAQIARHGSFAEAGRVLGIPKSRLSQRVRRLEEHLGVRLLQRTTRHLSVTEVGRTMLDHCLMLADQAQAACEAVDAVRAMPRGIVRVSCPLSVSQTLVARVLP
jgi:DNA-binding transcriptional LysR family regulator